MARSTDLLEKFLRFGGQRTMGKPFPEAENDSGISIIPAAAATEFWIKALRLMIFLRLGMLNGL